MQQFPEDPGMLPIRFVWLAVASILFLWNPASALALQQPGDGWNSPEAIELARRGAAVRASASRDTTLTSYSGHATGYVYFLLDAPGPGGEMLVRTDQVALDYHWRAPDDVRQHIVGLRERRELPITGLYYYLDRFTVIHDGFGESIRIADGDNVEDVPHPVGPFGLAVYDFRLGDFVTLRLPGAADPVRVRELQVRPRDPDQPAIIGSIFLDEDTGALVRMAFTFTPSAYVDPRLDFINVTLENGLWEGRYWLPAEQRLEIRRELPEIDLPYGTTIRTRLRIGNYRINTPTPRWLFDGRLPVTMLPRAQRENYDFDQPIDAEWRMEGIGGPPDVAEIRNQARSIVEDRILSGVPAGRMAIGSVSDIFRYNRAEGATIGLGLSIRAIPDVHLQTHGGWAFGAKHPVLRLDAARRGNVSLEATAYLNRPRDAGSTPTISGLANTLGMVLTGTDWTDPYFASGGEFRLAWPLPGVWTTTLTGGIQRQRLAPVTSKWSIFDGSDPARSAWPIEEGTRYSLGIGLGRALTTNSGGWWADAIIDGGLHSTHGSEAMFGRATLSAGLVHRPAWRRTSAELSLHTGRAVGTLPSQDLFLLGGRGSLPGFDYRGFAGDSFARLAATASTELVHPWARARIQMNAGWTGDSGPAADARAKTGLPTSDGIQFSIGAGLGLFYDLLQVDVARGFGSHGRTEVIVEFQAAFWELL